MWAVHRMDIKVKPEDEKKEIIFLNNRLMEMSCFSSRLQISI